MENESVGKDDKRTKFQSIWDAKSEEERQEFAYGLYQSDAGNVRKVAELKAEAEKYKAMAESGDLLEERAKLAAAKRFLDVQTNLIDRAVRHELDPAVAIQFARSEDPDSLFDGVLKEIDTGVNRGVNERLSAFDATPESSPSQGPRLDLSRLSAREISRLPQDVVKKYMTDQIMGA